MCSISGCMVLAYLVGAVVLGVRFLEDRDPDLLLFCTRCERWTAPPSATTALASASSSLAPSTSLRIQAASVSLSVSKRTARPTRRLLVPSRTLVFCEMLSASQHEPHDGDPVVDQNRDPAPILEEPHHVRPWNAAKG
eukprot:1233801-Rhodomonas_salina.1